MRNTKKNRSIPRRYYRPDLLLCPTCHTRLQRFRTLWHKYLVTLTERAHVFSQGYRCPNRRCPQRTVVHRSTEAEQLSPSGISFGFDVIVQIGWWRFWEHQTLDEIHRKLRDRHLSISRRHIANLILDFLALVYAAQPARLEEFRADWERHGLYISVDGMQPETGNDALYVVRELTHDVTLWADILSTRSADALRTQVVEPILALGFRLRGVVSDAEEGVRDAFATVRPRVAHQACQAHCLNKAGEPIFERDRAFKTDLKRDFRPHLRAVRRQILALPPHDPFQPILLDYAEALRVTLRTDGRPPFDLGGLCVFADLRAVEASLRRCQKKGGIRCSRRYGRSRCYADPIGKNMPACSGSGSG